MLSKTKILVLDEATAAVDLQTDKLIQQSIKDNFTNLTVLTIAHRLNTVMESDKILVMDAGKVVEFAHPLALLKRPDGYFTSLLTQTGQETYNKLKRIAEDRANILGKNPNDINIYGDSDNVAIDPISGNDISKRTNPQLAINNNDVLEVDEEEEDEELEGDNSQVQIVNEVKETK